MCVVPETDFNLSYESLTSREARQAIVALRSTDPEFYQEITNGSSEAPSGEEDGADLDAEQDEIDTGCTITELVEQVLRTPSLGALAGSILHGDEGSDGYESEEYGYSRPSYLPVSRSELYAPSSE